MPPDEKDVPHRLEAALTAAGDVAYDWDLGTDTILWHGSVGAMLGVADASAVGTGRALAGRLNPDLVVQRDGMEHGHQVVVAVGPRRTHRELEVEFGGHPRGHTGHDASKRTPHGRPGRRETRELRHAE